MNPLILVIWFMAGMGLVALNIHLFQAGQMNFSGDINVSREKHPFYLIFVGWIVITLIGLMLSHPITRLLFLGGLVLWFHQSS
ncbi:hypothetical protein [Acaryochloris sp. CCMEE 5410]|uniref:hypothetical protein n=1 Tax=Acaryochloris sp. CCMEE 5410 TaxID=310037 RepID=UPI0002484B28|nr:hypothetical protein [Acaryochloris sp. CCMEE 5410]KAI9129012.1 hypothetical protein ON05_037245 [Acaryochloris sp. CCMEE 5410]